MDYQTKLVDTFEEDDMTESKAFFLEDVVISGFKSFSESTEMGFQPGIGVIIGNNGVGKSNILDAIVWALGEDDLDRLRCYHRDELFFSGSKKYPPASKIRVELTFRKGKEREAPVIRLTREMEKEGQSNYWVQGKSLPRARYERELVNLKLPHALKSMIRQEQINDMILLNPGQRFQWVKDLLSADGIQNLTRRDREGHRPSFPAIPGFPVPRWTRWFENHRPERSDRDWRSR